VVLVRVLLQCVKDVLAPLVEALIQLEAKVLHNKELEAVDVVWVEAEEELELAVLKVS